MAVKQRSRQKRAEKHRKKREQARKRKSELASATEILVRSDLLLDAPLAKPERPHCVAATAESMPEEDVFDGLRAEACEARAAVDA